MIWQIGSGAKVSHDTSSSSHSMSFAHSRRKYGLRCVYVCNSVCVRVCVQKGAWVHTHVKYVHICMCVHSIPLTACRVCTAFANMRCLACICIILYTWVYIFLLTITLQWSPPPITTQNSPNPLLQPIADRVAMNLEIIFKTFSTNQNFAHGIYDLYQVINNKS